MKNKKQTQLDVAVIGGGPAGISACLELSRLQELKVALFERDSELGGIPRTCNLFFGFRDRKRIYTGRGYSKKLNRMIRKTSVEVHTDSTVMNLIPGGTGELHRIDVLSPEGLESYGCRFVLLATGCYETSREARQIPGTRPSGIFTTGSLQQLVNIQHRKPGKRALIVGSENVAMFCALVLKDAGLSVAGIVEEDVRLKSYALLSRAVSSFYRFPIYKDTSVKRIQGVNRVEAVELLRNGDSDPFQVECDTVIITGKFRPDSALIFNTRIELDPATRGPFVNTNLMTSIPNIFAAGNVLRGADMHDLCALEGKKAAQNILKSIDLSEDYISQSITMRAELPIRYVVPQKIVPSQIESHLFPSLYPGYCIQSEHTLLKPVLEAWSGNERIWEESFSKWIGRYRVKLPVKKFDWNRVDAEKGITLRLQS
jgi:NADPH-dependent 2,4-dienoyl-CoA reductase/sulfur reductase-like enzyme